MDRNRGSDTWKKVSQIRDKFEYDRERRMRDKGTFTSLQITHFICIHTVLNLTMILIELW